MRHAFMALLAKAPAHGYELKRAFEETFGEIWPELNFGQIYTTLSRLERDELVESYVVDQQDRRNKKVYKLTDKGRSELLGWFQDTKASPRIKDEFFMKLVLARVAGAPDPTRLIERQRKAYLQALRDLNQLGMENGVDGDPVTEMMIEGAALHLEADLKWLDLLEEKFAGGHTGGKT
jgi:DNA-binding PadR family transcriptional regulator